MGRTKNKQLDLKLIRLLKNTPTRKRNEEKIKQIWKRFLRKIFEDFKGMDAKAAEQVPALKGVDFRDDRWKRFYYFTFHDLIERDPRNYPLDLVMDICTEKTVGFVKDNSACNPREQSNWKTLKKVAAMKKVPASFRYLVSESQAYRQKFLTYLEKDNKNGIICFMTKIIKNKLNKMFVQWEQILSYNDNDWAKFLKEIEQQINNPKFKLPWLLSDIENAVSYCLEDLSSEKLKKEFTDIQQKHYSLRNK